MKNSYLRCRMCLKKCLHSNSTIVSSVNETFNCKYNDIIPLITGIHVQRFNVMCERCRQRLLDAYRFRLQAQEADEKIKSGGVKSDESENEKDAENESNGGRKMEIKVEHKYDDASYNRAFESDRVLCDNLNEPRREAEIETTESVSESRAMSTRPATSKKRRTILREKKKWLCPDCGKLFERRQAFIRHAYSHKTVKKYNCDYCKKGFNASDQLIYHIRKHTGDTPLVCPYCGRKFSKPPTFKNHLMTHTGEKPHECAVCNARFIQRHSLTLHMRKNHAFVADGKMDSKTAPE